MANSVKWALVEAPDTAGDGNGGPGEVLAHILPVVEVSGFRTAREAGEFRARCMTADDPPPVLTDDEDRVTATFFGHRLSRGCVCCPTPKESDAGLLVHHLAN
jgi:hypothetical protein